MTQTYYMWYNETTLEIQALNVDPTQVPAGSKVCKIKEKDLISFHSGNRQHHIFSVVVDNEGFAKFKHRQLYYVNERFNHRNVVDANIIQDLNYTQVFFDHINIKYSCADTITLTFDVDALEENYQELYIENITEDSGNCKIFITEYQDTSALLTSFDMDLYQLARSRILSIPLSFDKQISLWGVKL